MQHRHIVSTMGFSCFMLLLSLVACAGSKGNNHSQQALTLTAVIPVITATQATQATQAPPAIPTLTVNTRSLDPNSADCTSNGDGTYSCNVTVGESPQSYLHWSVTDNLNISINPSSGQLTPAQPTQQVTFHSIPCQSDTFTFSDQGGNIISITWSCTP